MSVYKDPASGGWRYRCTVTLKDGSTVRISGTPSAANTKLAAREAEADHRLRTVNPPVLVPKKPDAPGFETFAKTWLDAYPASADNRSSTVREKTMHVGEHLAPYWKEKPLDQIGAMEIATMISDLKKKPKRARASYAEAKATGEKMKDTARTLSPKTVKNLTQTLHKILTTAQEWGILDKVPKFPKRKKTDAPWDWYTAAESAALIDATKASPPKNTGRAGRPFLSVDAVEERALLLFALKTGARAGEQLAITWGDIDWLNKRVHFRRQYHKGEFRELKAGPARSVDMSANLVEALQAWRARQVTALAVARGNSGAESPKDLIFPRPDTAGSGAPKPRELWHIRDTLERYARRAGLRRIKWHELRHSFASQLVSRGVPLKQVQEWLGHSTIHMTMRYAHLAPTTGAGFIGVLDGPVATESPSATERTLTIVGEGKEDA